MAFFRLLRGLGFVAVICAFGLLLTAADAVPVASGRLLFVLFGANGRVGVDCEGNRGAMPCSVGSPAKADASVEILDLSTDPPTRRASVPLDAAGPTSLAVAPDGGRFFVVDAQRKLILTVVAATGAVAGTTAIPDGPIDCALSGDGATLYVTTAKPSVVSVSTELGAVVAETAPQQPWAERFSGIAVDPAKAGDRLAVAATSSAPALYLLTADHARLAVGWRATASGACSRPACGAGDDAAFTDDGRVLLASLTCSEIYSFAATEGRQISGGPFRANACLSINPQNSLSWNPLSRQAQVVWRGYGMGIAPGMPLVDPASHTATLLTDKLRIPEAAATTGDGRYLYVVSQTTTRGVPAYQVKGPLTFVLETYDVAAGTFSAAGAYAFDAPVGGRAAIDAKVAESGGLLHAAAGILPPAGGGYLGGLAGRASLLVFGGTCCWLDRRRLRRCV